MNAWKKAEIESLFTRLYYQDKVITAKADWPFPQKFPFCAETLIVFEKSSVKINNGERMTVYTDEKVTTTENDAGASFKNELLHFIECAINGKER